MEAVEKARVLYYDVPAADGSFDQQGVQRYHSPPDPKCP